MGLLSTSAQSGSEYAWCGETLVRWKSGWSLSKDTVWRRKPSDTFPRFKSDPTAEGQRKLKGEAPFVRECRRALCNLPVFRDHSRSRKELYRDLMRCSASDPLVKRLGWSLGEGRSHWNWTPGTGFLSNLSKVLFTWQLARNPLPLLGFNYKAGLGDMPNCPRCSSGLEETAEHAFACELVHPF